MSTAAMGVAVPAATNLAFALLGVNAVVKLAQMIMHQMSFGVVMAVLTVTCPTPPVSVWIPMTGAVPAAITGVTLGKVN